MSKVNKVVMSLEFAEMILPVTQNAKGEDIVPIKPISDVFGFSWSDQHKKLNSPHWSKRLGTCIGDIPYEGQYREMTFIRLNRVSAYFNSIHPGKVRAHGNEDGAEFLEQKQQEWDDLIHEYEMAGGILNKNESLKMNAVSRLRRDYFNTLTNMRRCETDADRNVLERIAHSLAAELGVPYQPELIKFDALLNMDKKLASISDPVAKEEARKQIHSLLRDEGFQATA